jgi:hypothetical protein
MQVVDPMVEGINRAEAMGTRPSKYGMYFSICKR